MHLAQTASAVAVHALAANDPLAQAVHFLHWLSCHGLPTTAVHVPLPHTVCFTHCLVDLSVHLYFLNIPFGQVVQSVQPVSAAVEQVAVWNCRSVHLEQGVHSRGNPPSLNLPVPHPTHTVLDVLLQGVLTYSPP